MPLRVIVLVYSCIELNNKRVFGLSGGVEWKMGWKVLSERDDTTSQERVGWSMGPLNQYEQECSVGDVDDFFSHLASLLDHISKIEIDRPSIEAHLSKPNLRDVHLLTAFSDIDDYISVTEDVLFTASQLSVKPSVVSRQFLVDWVTVHLNLCWSG